MYDLSDYTADLVVDWASEEIKRLEVAIKASKGPKYALHRKSLRFRIHELRCLIGGINTGEGVTRRSAKGAA